MSAPGPPRIVWSPRYEVDIGTHVFPTAKYRLVRDALLDDGTARAGDFLDPEPVARADLLRVHTGDFLRKIENDDFSEAERRQLEVPFSPELYDAMRACCGGTALAARIALTTGASAHIGGGFHHAFADHGEGFCLLNDVAVAIAALLEEGTIRRASVVDLDVHHGNGTAALFAEEPRVFTFSMHQQNNYPAYKPLSSLDIGLADGTGDDEYLSRLQKSLTAVLDDHAPDLVVYLAGADPYQNDMLGGLSLTLEGLGERDRTVLSACGRAGIPVTTTLAGGYAADTRDTVAIHATTVREVLALDS